MPARERGIDPAGVRGCAAMTFHFQTHDGVHAVEPEAVELPDLTEARREGIRRAGATLVLDARELDPAKNWHLDVTDAAGILLYRFEFIATLAPAARR